MTVKRPASRAPVAPDPHLEGGYTWEPENDAHGPTGWLYDPTHPRHQAALGWRCEVCQAPAGQPCINPVTPGSPLPGGRRLHHARSHPPGKSRK